MEHRTDPNRGQSWRNQKAAQDKERQQVRRNVARWGLRVICLACGFEGRHKSESQGRLHTRRCRCGVKGLRTRHWILKNPDAARKLRREHQQLEAVFS